MSAVICKIDNTSHESYDALHTYLRKFKISQKDYYTTHESRKDLLTGEDIPFKTVDQYMSAYFINKINAKKWFKENPEKAKELSIEILKNRVEKKKLTVLPNFVDCASAGLPSLKYYMKVFGQDKLEQMLGLKWRHRYTDSPVPNYKGETIIVDTREQTPLKLRAKTVSRKLEFGDYAIEGEENILAIERKSLQDLISSFVTNIERVEREIIRAKEAGAYLIVLCEESLTTALNYNYIPYLSRYTKIRPEVLFFNIRELVNKYDNLQFVFADGRIAAANLVEDILSLGEKAKLYDWQFNLE